MKRKRGNKKGKRKGGPPPLPSTPPPAEEEEEAAAAATEAAGNSSLDEEDNVEKEDRMEVDTPSSTGTDQPILNLASIKPDGSIDNKKKSSVVKVKLKAAAKTAAAASSKTAAESQSDTDKSSPQLGAEKGGGGAGGCGSGSDRMEDSGNSEKVVALKKKPGSIKIKSSSSKWKAMGGGGSDKSADNDAAEPAAAVAKEGEGSREREGAKESGQESGYNKQELDSALTVIKKVMKMDAAEPFNVPVNPEALGIPDYFDIIDTPMDFGTICSNLETGDKYKNSEDVYKDVQYIWDNCSKYNNKGDYILELMRRVKKNFMKYWASAGLYTEQSKGNEGKEGVLGDVVAASSQGQIKSAQSKKKSKKRTGRRHSTDCLCAICVLKRRKKEREESARLGRGKESPLVESPCGEDSSSTMGESLDRDADVEVEGKGMEMKLEVMEQVYNPVEEKEEAEEEEEDEGEGEENEIETENKETAETPEQTPTADTSGETPNQESQPGTTKNASALFQKLTQEVHPARQEEATASIERENLKEWKGQDKAKIFENLHENPMLLSLCGTLFPANYRSVWSGPHSLVQRQGSSHRSSIHAAIETLMK